LLEPRTYSKSAYICPDPDPIFQFFARAAPSAIRFRRRIRMPVPQRVY